MNRYEVLILTVPEVTSDETASLEKEIERLVKGAQAKLVSFERWGKYKLAYPVRDNDYGVYFLSRFEASSNLSSLLNDVRTACAVKFNDIVMRSMTTRLDERAPLTYNRPESLEEAPARDASAPFFKDRDRDRDRDREGRPSRSYRAPRVEEDDEDENISSSRREEMNLQAESEA